MFDRCDYGVSFAGSRLIRPCRAMPTYRVVALAYGCSTVGTYCEGHAISTVAERTDNDATYQRAMLPLPVTVEVRGKR